MAALTTDEMLKEEHALLEHQRNLRFLRHGDAGPVGLCISGGGIRSATFSLGFLQGLAKLDILTAFDYLSTVSGGGYIGSWLSASDPSPSRWSRWRHARTRERTTTGRGGRYLRRTARHQTPPFAQQLPESPCRPAIGGHVDARRHVHAELIVNWLTLGALLRARARDSDPDLGHPRSAGPGAVGRRGQGSVRPGMAEMVRARVPGPAAISIALLRAGVCRAASVASPYAMQAARGSAKPRSSSVSSPR